jgi:hypothetical protein
MLPPSARARSAADRFERTGSTLTNRINAYQIIHILELHRRASSADQIADLIIGSRSGCATIERLLEAFGQTPWYTSKPPPD